MPQHKILLVSDRGGNEPYRPLPHEISLESSESSSHFYRYDSSEYVNGIRVIIHVILKEKLEEVGYNPETYYICRWVDDTDPIVSNSVYHPVIMAAIRAFNQRTL